MPTINPTLGTVAYKFKGKDISVPLHFPVGHVLSENDARFANRQLASVTGNALASALNRKAKELSDANAKLDASDPNRKPADYDFIADVSPADAQTMFNAIFTNYEIGVTSQRGEGITRDPVESIANSIAWEKIKQRLKDKNIKVSSVTGDKKAELVKAMLDKDPSIMEQAKAAYGSNEVDDGMDALFANLGSDTTPAADTNSSESGASGTDTVSGDAGADTVASETGADVVTSSEGNDPSLPDGPAAEAVTTPEPPVDLEGAQPELDANVQDKQVKAKEEKGGKGAFA